MQLLISIYPDANQTCKTIAILAAQINGGVKNLDLHDLENVFRSESILYPSLNESYQIVHTEPECLIIYKEKRDALLPALEIKKIQP